MNRVIPGGIQLERSLRRVAEALHAAFRGPEGVDAFVATGPGDTIGALAFALARAIDSETIAPVDVEEIAGYFLTNAKEPRRRVPSASA